MFSLKKLLLLSAGVLVVGTVAAGIWWGVPDKLNALWSQGKEYVGISEITGKELGDHAFWEGRIAAVGSQRAYEDLTEWSKGFSVGERHGFAHTFGGALYAQEGVDGIAVCDARFSFGCYHEFLGVAIAESGLSSVEDLNEACFRVLPENSLSCQHGIGHGVLTDIGYDVPDIKKALSVCRDLPYSDPIGGCYGGVFMEYDHRTMWGDSAVTRDGDSSQPFALCELLDDTYAKACAFWTPQWWGQAFRSLDADILARAARMGSWCQSEAFGRAHQRDCFEGIGNVVSFDANFDPEVTRRMCEVTSGNREHQLWCLSIAANHLGIDVSVEAGMKVCEALPDEMRVRCESYALNQANIAAPI